MPISVLRIHDELSFKNVTQSFLAATNPMNFGNYDNHESQDQLEIFQLACSNYSFLLPSAKETTLEEWADSIDERYNAPQAKEVASTLRSISEKYSA